MRRDSTKSKSARVYFRYEFIRKAMKVNESLCATRAAISYITANKLLVSSSSLHFSRKWAKMNYVHYLSGMVDSI